MDRGPRRQVNTIRAVVVVENPEKKNDSPNSLLKVTSTRCCRNPVSCRLNQKRKLVQTYYWQATKCGRASRLLLKDTNKKGLSIFYCASTHQEIVELLSQYKNPIISSYISSNINLNNWFLSCIIRTRRRQCV